MAVVRGLIDKVRRQMLSNPEASHLLRDLGYRIDLLGILSLNAVDFGLTENGTIETWRYAVTLAYMQRALSRGEVEEEEYISSVLETSHVGATKFQMVM